MNTKELHSLFESFGKMKVLVIGDIMIDAYYWGSVERISPEAPVPVVNVKKTEDRLGGAANVALNLQALGAEVSVCAVIGKDRRGDDLLDLLRENKLDASGVLASANRKTTVKTRIISNHQQMLRVDEEQTDDINSSEEQQFIKRVEALIAKKPSVIIFEDYNKGTLTENVIAKVIALAKENSIATCVDPKQKNFFAYKGVTLFKPNIKELNEGLKIDVDKSNIKSITDASLQLESKLGHEISLITLSEKGVFIKDKSGAFVFPAHIRNIADVSGAGDTVIAVAALALAAGSDSEFIARLSNLAGGLVCEKIGVVPIDKQQLMAEANKEFNQ